NYTILNTLGLQTLQIIGHTESALLMEDVAQSKSLRLAEKEDMADPAVAEKLAAWYWQLHEYGKAYVSAHGQGMYDETDCITQENMQAVAEKTGTAGSAAWALLMENFSAVTQKAASVGRTLTYNDFYYTNMIVAKDRSAAFMFDCNLLGKGYVYADLRNVTSSLGREAGQAFRKAYGAFDPVEEAIDAVASILTTLHYGCQRQAFPAWAEEELEKVKNGTLEQALRRLLA
ncbi:MAG: hypothetical protein IH607_03865, partial [Firmicutes bacterium]|nr:hypothetical protein [Bacillota bacterium]